MGITSELLLSHARILATDSDRYDSPLIRRLLILTVEPENIYG